MFKSHQLYSSVENITRKLLNNARKLTERNLIVGGKQVISDQYQYNVFLTDSTVDIVETVTVDILLIGGGGAGGAGNPGSGAGGGGGAGGVLYGSTVITAGSYPIIVGSGGIGVAGGTGGGGGDTSAFGYTAQGGGGGGDGNPVVPGTPGGSGGGGGADNGGDPGGAETQTPSGTLTGYGFPGAQGIGSPGDSGGGGGGAGEVVNSPRIWGGNGRAFPIFPAPILQPTIPGPIQPRWTPAVGPTGLFGGGGGGGAGGPGSTPISPGGTGGGGIGKASGTPQPDYDTLGPGVNYTGGGGGGHARISAIAGKNGGNGIVIIRHLRNQ